jgi:8-amino-7-oxononanoate synthase
VPATDPFAWTVERAAQRRRDGLRRTLSPRTADDPALDLASNDYLGLARDPRVVEAAVAAARTWGAGATGSRLVTGSTELHARLEDQLATFVGTEAALVFSSGYLANVGVVTALADPRTLLLCDAHNHASLIDAARLSRARVVVYPHRDVDAVADALRSRTQDRAVVVTDSVFSVDGETAPLAELAEVCADAGVGLVVDEAHAVGVVGPGGRGAAAAAGLAGAPGVVLTATLSKALGAQGGALLASADVVAHVVDAARAFIFDTGLAPAAVGAAAAALAVLQAEPDLPVRARAATAALHRLAVEAGFRALAPEAAVVGARVGDPEAAVAAAAAARQAGVRVGCFRPPSVPDRESRLRLGGRADLDERGLALAGQALRAAASEVRDLGAP